MTRAFNPLVASLNLVEPARYRRYSYRSGSAFFVYQFFIVRVAGSNNRVESADLAVEIKFLLGA